MSIYVSILYILRIYFSFSFFIFYYVSQFKGCIFWRKTIVNAQLTRSTWMFVTGYNIYYILYFACCSDSVLIGLAATNYIVCHGISDHWFVRIRAFKYGDRHTIQRSSTKSNSNSFYFFLEAQSWTLSFNM